MRTALLTALALLAFASNSLFCRLALQDGRIDPASFSSLRLASGALVLVCLACARARALGRVRGSWRSALWLALYAIPFSFAYVDLAAGTGALVLFGAVQTSMLAWALRSGERPHALSWLGLALALGGLVYLVLPGIAAPSPLGCALMATAGIAWGGYSLRGRGAADALGETAGNFARALPLALVASGVGAGSFHLEARGALLACASGALASGLGYVVWYAALRGLSATRASLVQLAVPVIAAAGGVLLLSETLTARLVVAGAAILGGVGLALLGRERLAKA